MSTTFLWIIGYILFCAIVLLFLKGAKSDDE